MCVMCYTDWTVFVVYMFVADLSVVIASVLYCLISFHNRFYCTPATQISTVTLNCMRKRVELVLCGGGWVFLLRVQFSLGVVLAVNECFLLQGVSHRSKKTWDFSLCSIGVFIAV